jgi:hypothetical protein
MDPYLESHWRDVHHRLITYASDAIQETLPADLRARVEERVVLEGDEGLGHPFFPDARVIESRPEQGAVKAIARRGATQPILIDVRREPLTEGFIEIIDAGSGNLVVTVIEVLSPTNKPPGDGLLEYQRKQREITQSQTSLVEINLLRGGRHILAVPLENIPEKLRTPYMVCVRRATARSRAELYPIPLSQKLPTVNVLCGLAIRTCRSTCKRSSRSVTARAATRATSIIAVILTRRSPVQTRSGSMSYCEPVVSDP